jgi:hypothetical protein
LMSHLSVYLPDCFFSESNELFSRYFVDPRVKVVGRIEF